LPFVNARLLAPKEFNMKVAEGLPDRSAPSPQAYRVGAPPRAPVAARLARARLRHYGLAAGPREVERRVGVALAARDVVEDHDGPRPRAVGLPLDPRAALLDDLAVLGGEPVDAHEG
jgi:hypothetical protein